MVSGVEEGSVNADMGKVRSHSDYKHTGRNTCRDFTAFIGEEAEDMLATMK